jgi:hypothetical protein
MKFLLTTLLFLSFIVSGNAQKKEVSILKITAENNRINLLYGGIVRLTGGTPFMEGENKTYSKIKKTATGFLFMTDKNSIQVVDKKDSSSTVVAFFLSPNGNQSSNCENFLGLFFDNMPGMTQGITFYRYNPWNSWTEPLRIKNIQEMKSDNIQFFYWKYADGLYGAAMPLSGKGYRTTLGQENGAFGTKSVSYYNNMKQEMIPQMAVAFGKDPYMLFAKLYAEGLKTIGLADNLRKLKTFPKIMDGIGWCTWNSSDMGQNLNEKLLLDAAKSFKDAKFPMKWILIDDGWFDQTDQQMNSFQPNKEKFPHGFLPVVEKLKREYHIANVGVWHALDGYWRGINPNSPLGKKYKNELISWKEKDNPANDSSAIKTGDFINPNSSDVDKFYNEFHSYLKTQGISFVKVDNQLETERMSVNNFPIFEGAKNYHQALNASVALHFNNTLINCMDMTPDAYLLFGKTPIGRAEDDYYPAYEPNQSYRFVMQKAAGHVMQAVYNSLYFSQMVYPDFDMFESASPNATFHAIARAINDGPVYITDKVNQHDFNVLFPLVYSDGKILRAGKPLLPTEDCLFQLNDPKPFKAFSMDGKIGLLGAWNISDADSVKGEFKPADVHGIQGKIFAVYEYFSKELTFADRGQTTPLILDKQPYKLYYILPLTHGNAVIGLVNKYNAPAAILSSSTSSKYIHAMLYEGGVFAAVTKSKPISVKVNGKEVDFHYADKLLTVTIPIIKLEKNIQVDVEL